MRIRRLLSGVLVLSVFSALAVAQNSFRGGMGPSIHGVPPSVTSFNFGGSRGFHGVPASVTSLNFGSFPHPGHPIHPGFGFGHHHHHGFVNPIWGGYYLPYAYPMYAMEPGVDDSMEYDYTSANSRSAPDPAESIRQDIAALRSSVEDYRAELHANNREQPAPTPKAEEPVTNQPKTVLVFRDGHQVEVANYAIVGGTLYDLSGGRTKKFAVAELDVPATMKQNDDRGVDFRLPAGVKSN